MKDHPVFAFIFYSGDEVEVFETAGADHRKPRMKQKFWRLNAATNSTHEDKLNSANDTQEKSASVRGRRRGEEISNNLVNSISGTYCCEWRVLPKLYAA
jgi:hypothetical protein